MITKYHAMYYAKLLTQRSIGGDIDSLSQSLLNAAVDINPHQIEAALFAFKSPLTKGVILADEVGLGKTIEAALVLCQYWATGQKKLIIVCPASLRKQWSMELAEKFGMESEILDTKNFNFHSKSTIHPFDRKKVIICSYQFAARRKDEIREFGFDLAVLDEAHKLRNVYKASNKTAHNVRDALYDVKKLLLTATPFQNSLMELFGLTRIIDENIFGDCRSFRNEYINVDNHTDLQQRISPYYKRTLRRDVTEYIKYTKRLPLTQQFDASDLEQTLYTQISEFLRREDIYAVPRRQKMLTTMIIRKILASSTFALIGTLQTIRSRLAQMLNTEAYQQLELNTLLDEDASELLDENEEDSEQNTAAESDADIPSLDRKALANEIAIIDGFIAMAKQIKQDSKATALLQALQSAFSMLPATGAQQKALIFTESTRTQQYLYSFLEQSGYSGKLVMFSGANADKSSNAIYEAWSDANAYNGSVSGIKAADRKAAILDYFRNTAEIMIATEAAAEGLNLQFCSLVVNYDLPWNPQRIEQRIGRCHRYGQKSDVVVVNFVNQRNYADIRVFSILNNKFHLFSDVFGASDEILGQTDGVDFEKRIWAIYQECRTEQEINDAFEQLQAEMQKEIESRMKDVKAKVLENFDIEVQERLKLAKERTSAFIGRFEHIFWELTKFIIGDKASFDDQAHTFHLLERVANCHTGIYHLLGNENTPGQSYRLSHPLGQYVVQRALAITLADGHVVFRAKDSNIKVTLPAYLHGTSGFLMLTTLDVSAFDVEQYCLFTAYTNDGVPVSQEDCERLFLCGGEELEGVPIEAIMAHKLQGSAEQHRTSQLLTIDSRNLAYFREEENRIYRWEKDLIEGLERELDTVKRHIREQERAARIATTMEEKAALTKKVEELDRLKRRKRNDLTDREDEISAKRRKLIADLDSRMIRQTSTADIFTIRWQVN